VLVFSGFGEALAMWASEWICAALALFSVSGTKISTFIFWKKNESLSDMR
jgi:hypothetical protein